MSISHQTLSHPPLVWEDILPPGFAGIRLPGGKLNSATGEFGNICIQEFDTDHYTLQYNTFSFQDKFTLESTSDLNGLYSKLILKGKWLLQPDLYSSLQVTTNQLVLVNTPLLRSRSVFPRGLHMSFETFFSIKLLDEVRALFPASTLLNSKKNKETVWADIETHEMIGSIVGCRFEKELRTHFFNSRVRDLLFRYLLLSGNVTEEEKQPSEKELEAVMKAEQVISTDISKHINIPALSKKVLLNEFALKSLFKKVFGVGPYEYLVIQRLKKAKELLENGHSIKETAAWVGYRPSDFTTAFTRHFKVPPSSIKKKHS